MISVVKSRPSSAPRYGQFGIERVIQLALGRPANDRDEAPLRRQSSKSDDCFAPQVPLQITTRDPRLNL